MWAQLRSGAPGHPTPRVLPAGAVQHSPRCLLLSLYHRASECLAVFSCTSVFGFYLANLLCAGGASCIFLQLLILKKSSRGVTCQVSGGFDQADAWSPVSRHRECYFSSSMVSDFSLPTSASLPWAAVPWRAALAPSCSLLPAPPAQVTWAAGTALVTTPGNDDKCVF